MALAIDASSPALASGTTATITTSAFTTPASVFLLARVARNVGTAGANSAGTVSGAGLTWTKIGAKTDYASETGVVTGGTNQPACVEMWWAYSSSALTSVTVSDARSDGLTGANHEHALKVSVITGAESTPAGAKTANAAASGLPSTTTTTTAANAWLFSVSTDWLAKGSGTAGTGQTIENDYNVTGNISAHFWRQTSTTATSGSSVTNNLTAPSAEQYNMLTVEVRPSGVETHSGTLALAGSGALTFSGATPAISQTLAPSGSGTLSLAASAITASGSLPLSGGGTLGLAGHPTIPGSVALAGSGTLSLSGSSHFGLGGELLLSSTGTLTVSGSATRRVFVAPTTPFVYQLVPRVRRSHLMGVNPLGLIVYRLRDTGEWKTSLMLSPAERDAADLVYEGGRNYTLTPAEEAVLVAAGFGANITSEAVS